MCYRLIKSNIENYMKNVEQYTEAECEKLESFIIPNLPYALLQKNYGGDLDCTLTSITYIGTYFDTKNLTAQTIYDRTEEIATKFLYKPNKGTNPLFAGFIANIAYRSLGIIGKLNLGRYLKDFMWTFDTIKTHIKKGPMLLNMWNDGRNYYKNHTITIIGYEIYKCGDKTFRFLLTYDNWSGLVSYVDYDKISTISSIKYVK